MARKAVELIPMAKVTIVNDGVTLDVPDGARLLEYAKAGSRMLFGCEGGTCGVCICRVVKGKENLVARTQLEEQLCRHRDERLACQIWVKKGEIEVEY